MQLRESSLRRKEGCFTTIDKTRCFATLLFFRSLDSLLCDVITPTPQSGILFPDATHVSGDVVIFVRQSLSFSELSTPSLLDLTPPLLCRGQHLSKQLFLALIP